MKVVDPSKLDQFRDMFDQPIALHYLKAELEGRSARRSLSRMLLASTPIFGSIELFLCDFDANVQIASYLTMRESDELNTTLIDDGYQSDIAFGELLSDRSYASQSREDAELAALLHANFPDDEVEVEFDAYSLRRIAGVFAICDNDLVDLWQQEIESLRECAVRGVFQ